MLRAGRIELNDLAKIAGGLLIFSLVLVQVSARHVGIRKSLILLDGLLE